MLPPIAQHLSLEFENEDYKKTGRAPTNHAMYPMEEEDLKVCYARSPKKGWICTRTKGHHSEDNLPDYHEASSNKFPGKAFARWLNPEKKKGLF